MLKIEYPKPTFSIKNRDDMLATWFGSGLIKPASGTWGTIAALPFGIGITYIGGITAITIAAVIVSIIGIWITQNYITRHNLTDEDPKEVVIDEVAGMWIALIPAGLNPILIGLAFILFRFFDIFKIWPACIIDKKMKNASGIMLDDIVAGIYSLIIIAIINHTLFI